VAASASSSTSASAAPPDGPSPPAAGDSGSGGGRRHDPIPEEAEVESESQEGEHHRVASSTTYFQGEEGGPRVFDTSPLPLSSESTPSGSAPTPVSRPFALATRLPDSFALRPPTVEGGEERQGEGHADADVPFVPAESTDTPASESGVSESHEVPSTVPAPTTPTPPELPESRRGSADSNSQGIGRSFPVEWVST
jgi:hypothetical protein